MRIAKKPVEDKNISVNSSEELKATNKYDSAVDYIKKAIDSLASLGKDDKDAKDAIANLSVILFDLKG